MGTKNILNLIKSSVENIVKKEQQKLSFQYYVEKKIEKKDFELKLKEIEINYISLLSMVENDYKEMSNQEFRDIYNNEVGLKSLLNSIV